MTASKMFDKLHIQHKKSLHNIETWKHIDNSLKVHFDLKYKKVYISGYGSYFEWWFYERLIDAIKQKRKELGWIE